MTYGLTTDKNVVDEVVQEIISNKRDLSNYIIDGDENSRENMVKKLLLLV